MKRILGIVVLLATGACGGDETPCSGYRRETNYFYDENGDAIEETVDTCFEGVLADGHGDQCLILLPSRDEAIAVDDVGCEPGEMVLIYSGPSLLL